MAKRTTTIKERVNGQRVFATWETAELPEDLDDFHVSCGVAGEQHSGYFLSDDLGARLTIEKTDTGFHVRFDAPSAGLETHRNWWLSPNIIHGDEAQAWGIE